jgi:serine O-acetyltransferase
MFSVILDLINRFTRNSIIPGSVEIGRHTNFAYGGIGVVIHGKAKIGNYCSIGQGITIGGKPGAKHLPIIEDRCYLGAGCRIIGEVVIGHDSIIGPNAVITKNIPPYSVVVGIPGRVINIINEDNIEKYKSYGVILSPHPSYSKPPSNEKMRLKA